MCDSVTQYVTLLQSTETSLHPSIIFSERELKFMFAICHRRSVCRLSSVVCLSVCLSVVCNVGAPYSDD